MVPLNQVGVSGETVGTVRGWLHLVVAGLKGAGGGDTNLPWPNGLTRRTTEGGSAEFPDAGSPGASYDSTGSVEPRKAR